MDYTISHLIEDAEFDAVDRQNRTQNTGAEVRAGHVY
mgnify:CR=1 FL=1